MEKINVEEIDLSKLSSLKQFSAFFSSGEVEKLARQSGFISRSTSRLTGEAFLKMMVTNLKPQIERSLNDQCDYLQEQFEIEMTKQSPDERYHTFTVSFMKQCYQSVLSQSFANEITGLTTSFSNIYLRAYVS